MMVDIYRNDVDAGVHGAAAWLLRHWNAQDDMQRCDENLSTGKIENGRRWYLTHEGHTMTIINGPVGILDGHVHRLTMSERNGETQHRVTIKHSFAIGTTEITREQIQPNQPTSAPHRTSREGLPHQLYGVVPCG